VRDGRLPSADQAPAQPEVVLRPMRPADIDLVTAWLRSPEVARWYLVGSTVTEEARNLRRCIDGAEPTEALLVVENDRPVGWCQWYQCRDYPDHAAAVGAGPDDIGIDYAIGNPARRGKGVGTVVIAALITHIRQGHPRAGIIADPQASNFASRRVLEKNGFQLRDVRPVPSEPTPEPMAIYYLEPTPPLAGTA
jgi:aminoglycoside 6'-N-acetyltransferase